MARNTRDSLEAGTGSVEITPLARTHLAGRGDGAHRPAELVLDPLHARATVFQCGGRRLCFVALDVTIVTHDWSEHIRRTASDRWGFDPDAVMVHATQTHSAPPQMGRADPAEPLVTSWPVDRWSELSVG